MNLTTRIVTAAIAAATAFGVLPASAAPAEAQTTLSISYRDYDYRQYRDGRDYRRDRDYRGDQRDWRRNDRRNRDWRGYNQYRQPRHCWTELRWDQWRGERYRVRICR